MFEVSSPRVPSGGSSCTSRASTARSWPSWSSRRGGSRPRRPGRRAGRRTASLNPTRVSALGAMPAAGPQRHDQDVDHVVFVRWSAAASCCRCSSRGSRCPRSSPAWSSTPSTRRSSRCSATTRRATRPTTRRWTSSTCPSPTSRRCATGTTCRRSRSRGSSSTTGWSVRSLFEVTHERWVLLIFPNTFEYFFIAYELWRTRWSTPGRSPSAPGSSPRRSIWIFIKLPQEYWLHVAELDVTDTLRDYWWAVAAADRVLLVALAAILWFVRHGRACPSPTTPSGSAPTRSRRRRHQRHAPRCASPAAGSVSWMTAREDRRWSAWSRSSTACSCRRVTMSTCAALHRRSARSWSLNAAITLLFSRRNWTIESAAYAVAGPARGQRRARRPSSTSSSAAARPAGRPSSSSA